MISLLLKLSVCLGLAYYVLLISWTTCELTTERDVVGLAEHCHLGQSCERSETVQRILNQTFPCFGPPDFRAVKEAQLCEEVSSMRFEQQQSSGARFSCVLFGQDNIAAAFRLGSAVQLGPGPFPKIINDALKLPSLVPAFASRPSLAAILDAQSKPSFVQAIAAHATLAFVYALEVSLAVAMLYVAVRIGTEVSSLAASAVLTSTPWGSLPWLFFRSTAAHESPPETPPAPPPPAYTERVTAGEIRSREVTQQALAELANAIPDPTTRLKVLRHARVLAQVRSVRDAGGALPAALRDPDVHLASHYWTGLLVALLAYATLEWALPLYRLHDPTGSLPSILAPSLEAFVAGSRTWLRASLDHLGATLVGAWPDAAGWLAEEHRRTTLQFLHIMLLVVLPLTSLAVSYKVLAATCRHLIWRGTEAWDRRITLANLRWGLCAAGIVLGYRQSWHAALGCAALALVMEWGVAREDSMSGLAPLGLPHWLSSGVTIGSALSQVLWVPGLSFPVSGLGVPARDILQGAAASVDAVTCWLRNDACNTLLGAAGQGFAWVLECAHDILHNVGPAVGSASAAGAGSPGTSPPGSAMSSSWAPSSPVTGEGNAPGTGSLGLSVPAFLFLLFASARFWWAVSQLRAVAVERMQAGCGRMSAVYACACSPVLAISVAEGFSLLLLACLPHKGLALACVSVWPFLVQGHQGPRLPEI
eukprot:jgi/Mesvir1/13948/Mv25280-RA.1